MKKIQSNVVFSFLNVFFLLAQLPERPFVAGAPPERGCSGTARSLWICDIATTTKPVYSLNVSCCISLTKNTEAEGAIFLSIRYLDLQVYSLQSFTYHRATGRNMVHTNRRNEAATMDFQDFRLQIPRPIIAPCSRRRKLEALSEFFGHPDIQKDLQGHPAVNGVPQGRDDGDSAQFSQFRATFSRLRS